MEIQIYQDVGAFNDQMIQLGEEIQRNAELLTKTAAAKLLEALVEATPKKSGNAAGNWVTSLDAPSDAYYERPSHNAPGRDPGEAILEGAEVISAAGPDQSIFITNNAPYIGKLNDGSSTQAPAGFIEAAFLSIQNLSLTGGDE